MNINTIDLPSLEREVIAKMSDNGHAILSPSGANTWKGCVGSSVGMEKYRHLNGDNVASIEGTCAHALLELSLLSMVRPSDITPQTVIPPKAWTDDNVNWNHRILNSKANEGNDTVTKAAVEFFEYTRNLNWPSSMRMEISKTYDLIVPYINDGWAMIPELRVSLNAYLGHGQCDGTSDVVLYKGNHLIIADLKYGVSIEVSPVDNSQMKMYAAGAIDHIYKETGIVIDEVELVISQSRINNGVWKKWVTNYADINEWIINEVKPASIKALYAIANPDKSIREWFTPSLSACKWCAHATKCEARREHASAEAIRAFTLAQSTIEDSQMPKPFNPDSISDENLAEVLDISPFVIAWFKDAEKEGLRRVRKGKDVGGRKMVKGRKRRSWKISEDYVKDEMIKFGVPIDLLYVSKLKSPAQLEKTDLDPALKDKALELVSEEYGNDVMALSSDSRTAITPLVKVQNAFAKVVK